MIRADSKAMNTEMIANRDDAISKDISLNSTYFLHWHTMNTIIGLKTTNIERAMIAYIHNFVEPKIRDTHNSKYFSNQSLFFFENVNKFRKRFSHSIAACCKRISIGYGIKKRV